MSLNSGNKKVVLIDLTSLDDNFSGIEHYALLITRELIKINSIIFICFLRTKFLI